MIRPRYGWMYSSGIAVHLCAAVCAHSAVPAAWTFAEQTQAQKTDTPLDSSSYAVTSPEEAPNEADPFEKELEHAFERAHVSTGGADSSSHADFVHMEEAGRAHASANRWYHETFDSRQRPSSAVLYEGAQLLHTVHWHYVGDRLFPCEKIITTPHTRIRARYNFSGKIVAYEMHTRGVLVYARTYRYDAHARICEKEETTARGNERITYEYRGKADVLEKRYRNGVLQAIIHQKEGAQDVQVFERGKEIYSKKEVHDE